MTPEELIELRDMTPAEYLKRPYCFCLIWDEESLTYTGFVKEFPGCLSQGKSLIGTYKNLWQAAHDWIAAALDLGQEIPEPEEKVWRTK